MPKLKTNRITIAKDALRLIREQRAELDRLKLEIIGFEYAIQVLRRKCGLSNDSTDCSEIYAYIDRMQKGTPCPMKSK